MYTYIYIACIYKYMHIYIASVRFVRFDYSVRLGSLMTVYIYIHIYVYIYIYKIHTYIDIYVCMSICIYC